MCHMFHRLSAGARSPGPGGPKKGINGDMLNSFSRMSLNIYKQHTVQQLYQTWDCFLYCFQDVYVIVKSDARKARAATRIATS